MTSEYKPWDNPNQKLGDALPKRKTTDVQEGLNALKGIREKMGGALKKDQALKISMYVPQKIEWKEGERWEEDGKLWTIQNGIKQSISKVQDAKRPWFCPQCDKIMRSRLDDRMWILKGTCHDCVVKKETQMRLDGTWERYEKERIVSNQLAYVKDKIAEVESWKDVANPAIHFQDGTYEVWDVGVDKLKADIDKELDFLKKLLDALEEIYQNEFGEDME
jgi:hypothetical protein